jgi:hypothetical protein
MLTRGCHGFPKKFKKKKKKKLYEPSNILYGRGSPKKLFKRKFISGYKAFKQPMCPSYKFFFTWTREPRSPRAAVPVAGLQ